MRNKYHVIAVLFFVSFLAQAQNPKTITLNGVTVSARRLPKVTSTGEIYTLSEKAKEAGNPFVALSEIPVLNVDVSNQSVTMNSGESLLVLIDGRLVNTGIAPINSNDIESIEINEIVSARFLEMGVSKILNIHLKKDLSKYTYAELRSRNDIPKRNGFGGGSFEYGSSKTAVYGSLFYHYLRDDKITYDRQENFYKYMKGSSVGRSNEIDGNILLKWLPSSKDYVAFQVKNRETKKEETNDAQGRFVNNGLNGSFDADGKNKATDGGVLAGLYHEHTFDDKSTFTTFLKYNYGYYDMDDSYVENYHNKQYDEAVSSFVNLETKRNQYRISFDYESGKNMKGSLAIGNNFEYTSDEILNCLQNAKAGVSQFSNYLHATYSGRIKTLMYMGSLGMQHLYSKADGSKNTYVRPRASASLTLRMKGGHSLRSGYVLTNSLPAGRQLVTFNMSTNPLLREEGNPMLVPTSRQNISLQYTKNWNDYRLQVFTDQKYVSDMIESYIYTVDNVNVQTYRNNGTFSSRSIGVSINARWNDVSAYLSPMVMSEHYNNQSDKSSYGLNGNIRWNFSKFFVYATLSWINCSYTPIAKTIYKNPSEAHVQIAWNINKQWYASLGLPYFWGVRKEITTIDQDNYQYRQETRYKSSSLRPWLLVSWTMRKNPKKAIANKMPEL